MDLLQFHTLRTGVQTNAYPGSGTDLASMEAAFRELLVSSGIFEEVEVEHTDDPNQLVIGFCGFNPEYGEQEIANYIELIWRERVSYPFWEAHSAIVSKGQVEFLAATRESNRSHYVTVHLVAQKAHIPAQRGPVD
jgi:hypothetical protein